MVKEKIERKITVIFATDVVGYSKHMEADESETIHNLRECEAILTGLFEKHDGRLFNTGGDSFLAEFPSAVSAVECAVDFQSVIKERNASADTSVKLEFRIGINSGDVVKERDNLLGDGVNIAARLEALAQTNGITVSKVIYDYVKGKTKYDFNDLGIQKVKQNEFHAFDLLLEPSQKRTIKRVRTHLKLLISSICIVLLAVGGYLIFFSQSVNDQATYEKGSKAVVSSLPVILVYPFDDLGAS
jgi:adenylate cyclase